MKIHIIPSQEFTTLLLAIIHGLAKVEPPPVNPVNEVNPVNQAPGRITKSRFDEILAGMEQITNSHRLNPQAPLPDAHLNNLQAEIKNQDYATAPPEKLPPPHHGLVFPEDRRLIEFISRYLYEAIRLLGKGDEAPAFQELEQRFEQLRHFARQHSRTDEELIQSIIAFGRLYYLNSEGIIAAVKTSIQASSAAESQASQAPADVQALQRIHYLAAHPDITTQEAITEILLICKEFSTPQNP